MEGRDGTSLTRVGQKRDNGLRAADLRFWELEYMTDVACTTMDCTDPCGVSDLLALSGSIFVDIYDMVWAVGAVEIYDF